LHPHLISHLWHSHQVRNSKRMTFRRTRKKISEEDTEYIDPIDMEIPKGKRTNAGNQWKNN
jgi:hypothetical protein